MTLQKKLNHPKCIFKSYFWPLSGLVLLLLFLSWRPCLGFGPSFIKTPPALVLYSNNSGLILDCIARGDPPPIIDWVDQNGNVLSIHPSVARLVSQSNNWISYLLLPIFAVNCTMDHCTLCPLRISSLVSTPCANPWNQGSDVGQQMLMEKSSPKSSLSSQVISRVLSSARFLNPDELTHIYFNGINFPSIRTLHNSLSSKGHNSKKENFTIFEFPA